MQGSRRCPIAAPVVRRGLTRIGPRRKPRRGLRGPGRPHRPASTAPASDAPREHAPPRATRTASTAPASTAPASTAPRERRAPRAPPPRAPRPASDAPASTVWVITSPRRIPSASRGADASMGGLATLAWAITTTRPARPPRLALETADRLVDPRVRVRRDDMAHMTRRDPSRSSRTPRQAAADRHAADLARRVGKALRDARRAGHRLQSEAADIAGISRGRLADLEARADGGATLRVLSRAAMAVGGELHVYVSNTTSADRPRDAVHLRHQELIARTANGGGWKAVPEQAIDQDARTSRAADVLLQRPSRSPALGTDWSIIEVWDLFVDVGASFRDWDRRLAAVERLAIARMPPGDGPVPRTGGCWVVRATKRNRELLAAHRHLFRARFPGSPRAWLNALSTSAPMPAEPGLLWVRVDGTALYGSRLG